MIKLNAHTLKCLCCLSYLVTDSMEEMMSLVFISFGTCHQGLPTIMGFFYPDTQFEKLPLSYSGQDKLPVRQRYLWQSVTE